jgi:hypothetical protein
VTVPAAVSVFPNEIYKAPAQLGRECLPQAHLLQRAGPGQPLRRLAGARPVLRRAPRRVPLPALAGRPHVPLPGGIRVAPVPPGGTRPVRRSGCAAVGHRPLRGQGDGQARPTSARSGAASSGSRRARGRGSNCFRNNDQYRRIPRHRERGAYRPHRAGNCLGAARPGCGGMSYLPGRMAGMGQARHPRGIGVPTRAEAGG